jgi:hypothetical protein
MSIIFLERSKKITIGPGKEASSPHINNYPRVVPRVVNHLRARARYTVLQNGICEPGARLKVSFLPVKSTGVQFD